jgi:multiple sugar transport system ATP-binding protein
MNLVDCTLAAGHADLGDGARVALPAELVQRVNGAATLKFGVRPENLTLTRQAADDVELGAEVALLEPLGAETLATLRVGATEMVARCPAAFREPPGTRIAVHLNPKHMHLFDAATGNAL